MRVRGGNGGKIGVGKHIASRRSGDMAPRKFLNFRPSQIASGTFSGT